MSSESSKLVDEVRAQQRKWATSRGIELDAAVGDRDYVAKRDDNLFGGLCDETRQEFKAGNGDELEKKMRALHSSSALAVNVFEYWRDPKRDREPLATALGLPAGIASLRFEQKMPSGLQGNPPHLDVVFMLTDGRCLAVESKFLEPYSGHHGNRFQAVYFKGKRQRWAEHGFAQCQQLASDIQHNRQRFNWLDAAQLLKHILGLATQHGDPHGGSWQSGELPPWGLLYLWYALPGIPGEAHGQEVGEFASVAKSDGIWIESMTCQELFAAVRPACPVGHEEYLSYLESRYFGPPVATGPSDSF